MTRVLSKKECNRLGGFSKWNITSADPLGTTVRRITGLGGDGLEYEIVLHTNLQ